MRCFRNIAELIKRSRLEHKENYSQSQLSKILGYKNGQFISNVERGLCNIPLKMLTRISDALGIPPEKLKQALVRDHEQTLDNFLGLTNVEDISSRKPTQGLPTVKVIADQVTVR